MNPLIRQQFQNVIRLKVPPLTDSTRVVRFSKSDLKLPLEFQVDKYFVISLERDLFFDTTVSERWNKGGFPPSEFMLVIVLNIVGKMIQVEGVSYDPITGHNAKIPWTGWLPVSQVKIEMELED